VERLLRAGIAPDLGGTGKTRVIAEALRSLMASGKSALLVSGTNIAVDNAFARAVAGIKPRPGEMIRAGNPHLAEIAENGPPRVSA
jgi:hypothetical protein